MAPNYNTPRTYQDSTPSLPSDILFIILLLLPVKTLSRFKLVSKSWSSLISSPSFKTSHLRRSKHNSLLFVTTVEFHEQHYRNHILCILNKKGEKIREKEIMALSLRAPYTHRLVFSCLDLVCMYDADHIYIRNPTTKEQIVLSKKSSLYNKNRDAQYVKFAYLPSTGEYKVFRVLRQWRYHCDLLCVLRQWRYLYERCICEVFTLGSERWRITGSPPFNGYYNNMVVVDEAIHILPQAFSMQKVHSPEYDNSKGIARFDLKKEEWSVLTMPGSRYFSQYSHDEEWMFYLNQINGLLSVECVGKTKVDVWLLEDYNNCVWVKTYSIGFHGPFWFNVVEVEEDGRLLLKRLDGKLQLYNPKTKRVEATIFSGKRTFQVSSYIESMMSLDDESFKSLKKQDSV